MAQQVLFHNNIEGLKLLWLFWATAILFACNDQVKSLNNLKTYNADSIKLNLKNGVLYKDTMLFTGRLYKLFPNADTLFVQDFDKGLKNGYSKVFYGNKKPAEIRYFKAGKKELVANAWWPNGSKKFQYSYKNDEFNGLQQEWFSNGQMYSSKNYLNGYEDGMQRNWDSMGAILSNYEVFNGRDYGNIGQKHCKSIFEKDSFIVRN